MAFKSNFINCVQKYPQLYNKSIEITQVETENLWRLVSLECNLFSVDIAKESWKRLMEDYMDFLINDTKFGFAQEMEFIQPHLFKALENYDFDDNELLQAIVGNEPEKDMYTEEPGNDENSTNHNSTQIHNEIQEKIVPKSNIDDSKSKSASNLITTETEVSVNNIIDSAQVTKSMNNIQIISDNNHNSFTNLSPLELLFLSYAKQLQKMPLKLKLRTKRMISDIMDDAEMEMMEEQ